MSKGPHPRLAHELLSYAAAASMVGLFLLQLTVTISPETIQIGRDPSAVIFGYGYASASVDAGSSSSAASCGNGVKETGEACDASDYGSGQNGTCATYAPATYQSGSLSCEVDCSAVNVGACVAIASSSVASSVSSSVASVSSSVSSSVESSVSSSVSSPAAASCGDGIVQSERGENCEPPGSGTCDADCHQQTGGGGTGGGGTTGAPGYRPPASPPAVASSRSSSRPSSSSSSPVPRAFSMGYTPTNYTPSFPTSVGYTPMSWAQQLAPYCCEPGGTWHRTATCRGIIAFGEPKSLICSLPDAPTCDSCSLCGQSPFSYCTRTECENALGGDQRSCVFQLGGPLSWFGGGSCNPAPAVCPDVVWCCSNRTWQPMSASSCTQAGGSIALGPQRPTVRCERM
jgi:hypothetical protein